MDEKKGFIESIKNIFEDYGFMGNIESEIHKEEVEKEKEEVKDHIYIISPN